MTPLPPLPADIAPMGRKGDDMTDTTHDIAGLIERLHTIGRYAIGGSTAREAAAALVALQTEKNKFENAWAEAEGKLSTAEYTLTSLTAERDDAQVKRAAWELSARHLGAERDAAISKVDFYEQKDGMGGAVVHAIREILYAHNVPKAAFIDDHVTNAIVQRDAWKARAEAAEAKLRKAVGALGDISNGEPEWPDDPQKELDWCRNRATTALAELKRANNGKD